jgi:hypothetical protein
MPKTVFETRTICIPSWPVRSPRDLEISSELNGGANVDEHYQITLVYLIPTYGLFFG